MEFSFVLGFACFLGSCEGLRFTFNSQLSPKKDTNLYLNTLQIIRKYGYPAEAHEVETRDGYLLELHRIPHGRHCNTTTSPRKGPVFVQHGLLSSSNDFVLAGPEKGLVFVLADLGFDVWMGNVRGNDYGKAHVSLTPEDRRFWDFSWHESGIYDLSAQIDYVCNFTSEERIPFIGYSMGTTLFFVLTSTVPEYSKKIEAAFLLAPVAYLNHVQSIFFRFLSAFGENIKIFDEILANGELFVNKKLFSILGKFCEATLLDNQLCQNSLFLVYGCNPNTIDENFIGPLTGNFFSSYSVKGANHFAQLVKSGKFRQYDYGKSGNIARYGASEPPDYRLEDISIPTYFYLGMNDNLATIPDVRTLSNRLRSLRGIYTIPQPDFSHLDFVVSTNIRSLLIQPLTSQIVSFLNETKN